MIRPIDTQTIYQQTQELSNRQQIHNQGERTQQGQFMHIMQEQAELKKDTVSEIEKEHKINNDLNNNNKKEQNEKEKENQKKSNKSEKKIVAIKDTRIDIRI